MACAEQKSGIKQKYVERKASAHKTQRGGPREQRNKNTYKHIDFF